MHTEINLSPAAANELNQLSRDIFNSNVKAGWYTDLKTGEPLDRNIPEMLALIHSEVSEVLEGYRKNLKDDHLPHRSAVEVELADVIYRVFDLCGYLNLDIGGAFVEKHRYNQQRQDHKVENRLAVGGKAF